MKTNNTAQATYSLTAIDVDGDFHQLTLVDIADQQSVLILPNSLGGGVKALSASNIKDPTNFVASVLVSMQDVKRFVSVSMQDATGKITAADVLYYDTPKATKPVYVVGGVVIDVGATVTCTDVHGNPVTFNASILGGTLVNIPVDGKYCANNDINAIATKFAIDYDAFVKHRIGNLINTKMARFKAGDVSAIYVPARGYFSKNKIDSVKDMHRIDADAYDNVLASVNDAGRGKSYAASQNVLIYKPTVTTANTPMRVYDAPSMDTAVTTKPKAKRGTKA